MLGQLFSFHLPSWEPTLNCRRGSQERSVISSSWTASLMLPQERCWVGLGHYHVGFRSLCRWSWGHSSLQETFDESALWDRAVNTWCFARFTDVASREVSCLPIGMILIIPERNNRSNPHPMGEMLSMSGKPLPLLPGCPLWFGGLLIERVHQPKHLLSASSQLWHWLYK